VVELVLLEVFEVLVRPVDYSWQLSCRKKNRSYWSLENLVRSRVERILEVLEVGSVDVQQSVLLFDLGLKSWRVTSESRQQWRACYFEVTVAILRLLAQR